MRPSELYGCVIIRRKTGRARPSQLQSGWENATGHSHYHEKRREEKRREEGRIVTGRPTHIEQRTRTLYRFIITLFSNTLPAIVLKMDRLVSECVRQLFIPFPFAASANRLGCARCFCHRRQTAASEREKPPAANCQYQI